jgi:methyltransferase (TIGR00027 family)
VFVCEGRAVADGRFAVGRFADAVAARLLRRDELLLVELARAEAEPADWRRRLAVKALQACAEVVVPRTVAIDDAIDEAGNKQVVLIGAGLDSRPWRPEALRGAAVFLLDHPSSQADAQRRSAGLVPVAGRLEFVPANLASTRLDVVLHGRCDSAVPTTWIWEGVVPYLTRAQVEATVAGVAACSAPGSIVIVNYQTPTLVGTAGRGLARLAARLARQPDPLAREPWRSLWRPDAMHRLLETHGFRVRDDRNLLELATRSARRPPSGGRSPAGASRSLRPASRAGARARTRRGCGFAT